MAANVRWYHPNDPNAWLYLYVTMKGLSYLLCRKVIKDVLLCTKCGEEVVENVFMNEHCIKVHQGQKCSAVKECDWLVLRIGKPHPEN